jgi:ubiquinone biosynthesis protein
VATLSERSHAVVAKRASNGETRRRGEVVETIGRAVGVTGILGRLIARILVELFRRQRAGSHPGVSVRQIIATQLSNTLAELGPTFTKLGQVLSTRPDLVSPVFEDAFALLQDSAPTVPIAAIHAALQAALGTPICVAFSSFTDEPLAAASIGQVHAAMLHDGRQVVVKIRRPGVRAQVEVDLSILRRIAHALSAVPGPARQLDLIGFVSEFSETIRAELDYLLEGANADQLRTFLSTRGVHVPEVIWPTTTEGVLTLERIYGAKIDDLRALDALGVDRRPIARSFAETYLSMVFINGFFHADPHPGNLFVEASGRIAMVDFGMVGTVSPAVRGALVEILLALCNGDTARSARALHKLGVVPGIVDEQQFLEALEQLTAATIDVPLGDIRLGPLLVQFMAVSRRFRLRFPRELALLVKTVIMCEGLAAKLDPDFSLALVIAPFVATTFQSSQASRA